MPFETTAEHRERETLPNGFLPGLQSVSKEQIDNKTLEMVNAGLQLS
jgi:hypothetical protein